jgi:hypothetical protein
MKIPFASSVLDFVENAYNSHVWIPQCAIFAL